MKTKYAFLILMGLALLVGAPVYAQENMEDWFEDIWQDGGGTFSSSVSGTMTSLDASGNGGEAWGSRNKTFENAFGMIANVNVTAIDGNASMGIRKYVGILPNGNRVLAEIYATQTSSGDKAIYYRLRERDTSNATVQNYGWGIFGDWDGTWTSGQDILIAFAVIGNDVWFASSISSGIVKIQPFAQMTVDTSSGFAIYAWSNSGAGNSISGTVNNVTILP
jgi:hypothetical protein